MSFSRLDQLLKFLEEDPDDPFTLYGIAMEYTKADQNKALNYFNRLLKEHPEYVPTYYHAGKLLEKLGHKDQAENIYKTGMRESQKAGNNHAFRELQSAYNQLLDDDE